ncbi:hypothetical protein B0T18DRAFT_239755 [Schizothecium vesticola]|uniref:Uncharacterized protein n=1 Tax=Schizothecium vesticola TaxID=314040 RepID=A0AA40EGX6_9PEZI|nr:hypothetical protein B0T18DRAFT_239755 [Schizothecium vesticola]
MRLLTNRDQRGRVSTAGPPPSPIFSTTTRKISSDPPCLPGSRPAFYIEYLFGGVLQRGKLTVHAVWKLSVARRDNPVGTISAAAGAHGRLSCDDGLGHFCPPRSIEVSHLRPQGSQGCGKKDFLQSQTVGPIGTGNVDATPPTVQHSIHDKSTTSLIGADTTGKILCCHPYHAFDGLATADTTMLDVGPQNLSPPKPHRQQRAGAVVSTKNQTFNHTMWRAECSVFC